MEKEYLDHIIDKTLPYINGECYVPEHLLYTSKCIDTMVAALRWSGELIPEGLISNEE